MNRDYKRLIQSVFIPVIFLSVSHQAIGANTENEFPGRSLYPAVPYIEIEELYQGIRANAVTVIDVRSQYEFDTMHITKAINIPLASSMFVTKVSKIRRSDNNPIVVYCNGKTCMKSYKAVQKLSKHKISDVIAFDAGILDFAKAHPNETILLGKPLKNSNRLISTEEFRKHVISPSSFGKKIANSDAILLDIRDRVQREDGISMFVGREHRVTLDNSRRMDRYIAKAKKQNKTLLIYDAAGKQVRWLQYYFKENNIKDYYFMDGGITAYYKEMRAE